jgi:hypothetical protein
MKYFKLFSILIVITTCHQFVLADKPPQIFFPDLVFEDSRTQNQFTVDWYTQQLTALAEPSLFEASKDKKLHCYRFLWLRTFDHPIALRLIVDPEGTGLMYVKVADGAGGYEPGKLITNDSVAVTKQNVDKFLLRLNKMQFWKLPTREKTEVAEDGTITISTDGAQWILEAVRDGQYHVVDRHSPEKDNYREAALFLIDLAHLKIKNVY